MSDPALLDDAAGLERADPAAVLRATASAAAQLRSAAVLAAEAGVDRVAQDGRPRAVVVCGGGLAGGLLEAVAGPGLPVPVVVHRGFGLPSWAGAVDLVVALSATGRAPEPLSALEEAVRRGCRTVVVAPSGSPLDDLGARGRAVLVAAGASLWALATPLLLAGSALGLLELTDEDVEAAAIRLETVAQACRIDADALVNPAKRLALALDAHLPVVWGASPVAGFAAGRFASRLHDTARHPAMSGVLPDVLADQAFVLDGPCTAVPARDDDDFFRDRVDDEQGAPAAELAVVLLRDADEQPAVNGQADRMVVRAREHGVEVHELASVGDRPLERLASLVGMLDFASAYLALLQGTDPAATNIAEVPA